MGTIVDWTPAHARAVGARVRAARNNKGLSLQQVADRLAVEKATVGHWETGLRTIKLGDLTRLCTLLEVSADKVLFDVERWPFTRLDYESVSRLDPMDLARLEGAVAMAAMQLELDLGKTSHRHGMTNVARFPCRIGPRSGPESPPEPLRSSAPDSGPDSGCDPARMTATIFFFRATRFDPARRR